MNELAKQNDEAPKQSVLATLARQYNSTPAQLYKTLKETISPKATDAQMQAFCIVAMQYNLNPFTKEIYAFPQGSAIVPMVSVDGWIKLINRHPQFDGENIEFSEDGKACTVTIYRKDRSHPTVVTEYLDECKRNTPPWNTAPRRMLRHRALIQCARIAFGFSGIYDPQDSLREEVQAAQQQQSEPRNVTPPFRPIAEELSPEPEQTPAELTTEPIEDSLNLD